MDESRYITSAQHEALEALCAGYFHEDWPDFDRSWQDVVARFQTEAVEYVPLARDAITGILRGEPAEAELEELFLFRISCRYDPRGDDLTYTEWLARLLEVLSQPPPGPKDAG